MPKIMWVLILPLWVICGTCQAVRARRFRNTKWGMSARAAHQNWCRT